MFIVIPIDIPVDYATPKRECIDRDSQRIWDQIKGNLYISGAEYAIDSGSGDSMSFSTTNAMFLKKKLKK